jgi:hypothetical protein
MKSGLCPLCGSRRGKRPCPGKAGVLICSACCGSKRRVEVECPHDCAYLTGTHAPAWDGRESDRRQDLVRVAPHVEALSQDEAALFFYLLAGIIKVGARHRDADDARWREALAALRKTLETQESGIVYEHRAGDWQADALVRDMREILQPPEAEGKPLAPAASMLAAVAAVGAAFEATAHENAGPRAFLETASRLAGRIAAEEPRTGPAAPKILAP